MIQNSPTRPYPPQIPQTDLNALRSELQHELLIRQCRTDYYQYVQYTNQGFVPTRFHNFLCHKVQEFIQTPTTHSYDILLLSVPPQHGKSLSITETLPSWYLGNNPTHRIIVAGYSGDFVKRFGRRNLDKIATYGQEIFGTSFTLADNPCNTTEFELSNHLGRAIFAGLTSGITGNPANLIILDDVIKNRQEAYSPSSKELNEGEYLYSIKTRLAAGAKIIAIGTRWTEDDFIGWLEKNELYTTVINLPCECTDPTTDPLGRKLGDPLMPEIGKGRAWVQDFKRSYIQSDGMSAWNALFQGTPVADGGNMWQKDWWQYYTTPPAKEDCTVALSVDATFKDGDGNDYCVIETWYKQNNKYYLIDLIRKRMGFVDTLTAIKSFQTLYSPDFVYIEDKANGSAIIDTLRREFNNIIPVQPSGGKMSRASAVSHLIENKQVYLPQFAGWLETFLQETTAFPAGAHDDQVDATSQALNRLSIIDATYTPEQKRTYTHYSDDMLEDYERANPTLRYELIKLWGYPTQIYGEETK